MKVDIIRDALQVSLGAIFAILVVTVAVRILSGRISTQSLLVSEKFSYDPERLLLLVATLASASYYIGLSLPLFAQETISSLPSVPEELLYLLGGSQFAYLTGKKVRMD